MTQSENWPLIARGRRGGDPPTEWQQKIIDFARSMGQGPFGESVSREEIAQEFPAVAEAECAEISTNSQLDLELYDAVCAGWLKCYPGESYDAWERPRPERTDLPVEDRDRPREGMWTDSGGGKHFGSMAYEGDDTAMAEAMEAIERAEGDAA